MDEEAKLRAQIEIVDALLRACQASSPRLMLVSL
jgi:hypothetical protein